MTVPPRLELALLPTPILKLERLSRRLGIELYVKRDDLTGLLESGGEVRKLEFLAAEALAQGADTLITCGRPQSNALPGGGGRRGAPRVPRGDRGGGGAPRGLRREPSPRSDARGGGPLSDRAGRPACGRRPRRHCRRGACGGGRPYLIPEGGANEVGALGYLEGAVELAEQINHGAPRFDTVVIAAESGASQAGLLMGKHLAGLPSEIVGVPVTDRADVVRGRIAGIIETAIRRFGFAIDVPKAIHLLDGYQGRAAAALPRRICRPWWISRGTRASSSTPSVTIKAFRGLLDTLGRDAKALGQRVCFIHSGGPFSLFPLRDRLSSLLDHI